MKKKLRLAPLAAAITLTFCLPMHPKAQASTLPECTTFTHKSCDPSIPGTAQCYWYTAEEPGSCTCNPATSRWVCDL
jgi:hypothetical protein